MDETEEWCKTYHSWTDCLSKLDEQIKIRDDMFKELKTKLNCHPEFANHTAAENMIKLKIAECVINKWYE